MATFSGSGVPTELIHLVQTLQADVREIEGNIKKEQEFCEYLQNQQQSTKENTSSLQEKSQELDENVKRMHDVFVSQKKSNQRAKDNIAALDEKIRTETACLEQLRNECNAKREAGEKKLRDGREKFEQYMELYKTFPLVPEYLREQQKLGDLEQREQTLILKIQEVEDSIRNIKKQREEASNNSRSRFASITQWATAAAKKYVEIMNRKRSEGELREEIRQLKDSIDEGKKRKAAKERELAMAEEQKQPMDSKLDSNNKDVPVNSTMRSGSLADISGTPSFLTRYKNFFKKSFTSYGNFFGKQESPQSRQVSEPNLQLSVKGRPTPDFDGKTTDAAKSPLSLYRSQSMTALARGSSGCATAPMAPSSSGVLDAWLATKEQYQGKAHIDAISAQTKTEESQPRTPTSPVVVTVKHNTPVRTTAGKQVSEDTTEKMDTDRPVESTSPTPGENLHPSFFSLAALCKSPEDDFKFATRKVAARRNNENSDKITTFLSSAGSPWSLGSIVTPPRKDSPGKKEDASRTEDFPFAVPFAPPPGRRHGTTNLEKVGDSKMAVESPTQHRQQQMTFSGTDSLSGSFSIPASDSGHGSMTFQSSMGDFSFSLNGGEIKSPEFSLFGSGQQQQSFDMLDSSEQSLGGLF